MPICEWCGKEFAEEEAAEEFECEFRKYVYSNVRKCLCGGCAIQAIEDQVDGVYFEVCEECGKTFDVMEDNGNFMSHFSACSGAELWDYWNHQILCCDCALDMMDNEDEDTD